MESASSEQLSNNQPSSESLPDDNVNSSFTSTTRLRVVKLNTPGSLLILSLILTGCGIAMILIGILIWTQDSAVKGVTIAGVFICTIGIGVGLGAWFVHRKAKHEREHRMPVVTISLSQTVQRDNYALDTISGYEVTASLEESTTRNVVENGPYSNKTYYHENSDEET